MTPGTERSLAARQASAPNRLLPISFVGVLALGLALFVSALLRVVVTSGRFIPQQDLTTDYVTGVAWAVLLGASIVVWPVRATDKPALLGIWVVKCLVTLGLMLVYEANYWFLDAYDYFDVPRWSAVKSFGLGAGTDNMMVLSWLHQQLVPNSYHALKVSCSMVGLLAIYVFYRAAEVYVGRTSRTVLCALALYPSVLFWSSILGKDPIILLGVALYTLGFIGWYRRRTLRYVAVLALGGGLAVAMRLWLAPILLAPLAIVGVRLASGPWRRAAVVLLGATLIFGAVNTVRVALGLPTFQDLLTTLDSLSRAWAIGGSGSEPPWHFVDVGSLLKFAPLGAFTALFRPLPGEVPNPFGLLAGMENVVLLVLLSLAVTRVRIHAFRDPGVLWAISLLTAWAVVYGFVSYQNLGTAARFKLQVLPVLLLLLLHLARRPARVEVPTPNAD